MLMVIDKEVVKQATRLVDTSEYKRRQAPPGVEIAADIGSICSGS